MTTDILAGSPAAGLDPRLNAGIPSGPIEQKWGRHKFDLKLVNPSNRRKYTILFVGTGLAGGAGAASLGELGFQVRSFTYNDSARRAHSIAAQGGINAAKNYRNDGDSVWRLFYDTVKGGDFRSREANVYRLAELSVAIIDQCVAQGVPFAREYGGLLDTRSFGGAQLSRTFYALGQTGQQLLLGAYQAPSLIVKEGADFEETIKAICKEVYPNPVSAEVTATDYEGMLAEGKRNKAWAENVVVKIPMIPEGLKATKTLSKMGIPINMTLIFSPNQGLAAAKAGASYLSPFIGRLDDIGQDGMGVIRDLVAIKNAYGSRFKAEILVASIRHPIHVLEAAKLGADIGTMPAEVMDKLLMHPLTDSGLKRFLDDWNKAKKEKPSLTV